MNLFSVLQAKSPVWENSAETGHPPATPPATPPANTETDPPADPNQTPPADTPPATPEPLTAEAIQLPEGYEIPEESMTSFLGIMNNAEMTSAQRAQALIDLQAEALKGSSEAAQAANEELWAKTQETWESELKADPEIGGDKLPETLANIKKGLTAAGATEELFTALDLTGAGTNPHIVKMLHVLTKPHLEGGHVNGKPSDKPLSQADRLFGQATT